MSDQEQGLNADASEPSTQANRPSGITDVEWALIRQHREAELPKETDGNGPDPSSARQVTEPTTSPAALSCCGDFGQRI